MEIAIPERLATLGHPQRLALFRLLMRRYPDRVPASELAEALGVKANTLSTYVNALMQVGLITQDRVGTSRLYAIDMATTRETLDYLLMDCCRGRPELCATPAPFAGSEARRLKVLFLCTGNTARSIMAEALLRDLGQGRFDAFSAGTRPKAQIHATARQVLHAHGHDLRGLHPKAIAVYQTPKAPAFDVVFTVCDQAANEDCPVWPSGPITAHWGMPDPQSEADFQRCYEALHQRITTFTELPFATLDRLALQEAVDAIARDRSGILA